MFYGAHGLSWAYLQGAFYTAVKKSAQQQIYTGTCQSLYHRILSRPIASKTTEVSASTSSRFCISEKDDVGGSALLFVSSVYHGLA